MRHYPRVILDFEKFQMVQSLLQGSIIVGNNCSNGGNIYLRSSCCQRHQFQYLLKKSILKSDPQLCSWPCQVLNHVFICLRTTIEELDIEFHIIHSKSVLIEKYIPSFVFFVRVCQGEDIPHTIFYHVLPSLIPVGFYRDFRIYFYRNSIKIDRAWNLEHIFSVIIFFLNACARKWLIWIRPQSTKP